MPNRVDSPQIGNPDPLWRRLLAEWLKPDGSLSSLAFLNRGVNEVSVHWSGKTSLAAVKSLRHDAVAEVKAGDARSLAHAVVYDPTPADPSHTLLCAARELTNSRIKELARAIARSARLV